MDFWWVNHKQTMRQEVEGGYLWSPKREANGARSQFYENMRLANPGDRIISYASGAISYIGTISDYAISASKPSSFGTIGSYWANEGWLLPIHWHPVEPPIQLNRIINEIRSLFPERYSPINPLTGHGNQKAYLAKISPDLFQAVSSLSTQGREHINSPTKAEIIEIIETSIEAAIRADTHLSETEKDRIIKSRVGQGDFRKRLIDLQTACRVTGITNHYLLKASHIKPWRSCTTALERLDPYNGLLLAPHIDHLFDKGFITFSDAGGLIISSRLAIEDAERIGIRMPNIQAIPFQKPHIPYLSYHRTEIFLGD